MLYNLPKKLLSNLDFLKQYVLEHLQCHKNKFVIHTNGSKSEFGVGFAVKGKNIKSVSFCTICFSLFFRIKCHKNGTEYHRNENVGRYYDL